MLQRAVSQLDESVQLGVWIPEEDKKEFNDSVGKFDLAGEFVGSAKDTLEN